MTVPAAGMPGACSTSGAIEFEQHPDLVLTENSGARFKLILLHVHLTCSRVPRVGHIRIFSPKHTFPH